MKKLILIFAATILVLGTTMAQQEQQYTQYFVNGYTINPAMGGTEDFIDLKLGYRYQWVGVDGAPVTYYVSGHSSIGKEFRQYHHLGEHKAWHGVGGYIYKDKTGPISRTSFSFSYAYNMPLNKHIRLSTGIFAGMKQFAVDGSQWNFYDTEVYDGVVDEVFSTANLTKVVPDISAGMWLYSKDYYVGLSVYQLLGNNLNFDGVNLDGDARSSITRMKRHMFLTAGLRMPMSRTLNVIPSVMVKYIWPSPPSVDINVKADFDDKFFGAVSYRIGDAFSIIGGVVIKQTVEVSYSFDLTHTALRIPRSHGVHEIVIGYRLKHPKHVICPSRFW